MKIVDKYAFEIAQKYAKRASELKSEYLWSQGMVMLSRSYSYDRKNRKD